MMEPVSKQMRSTQLLKTLHNAQNLELALGTIQPCTTRTGCYVALFFGGALWGQLWPPGPFEDLQSGSCWSNEDSSFQCASDTSTMTGRSRTPTRFSGHSWFV